MPDRPYECQQCEEEDDALAEVTLTDGSKRWLCVDCRPLWWTPDSAATEREDNQGQDDPDAQDNGSSIPEASDG